MGLLRKRTPPTKLPEVELVTKRDEDQTPLPRDGLMRTSIADLFKAASKEAVELASSTQIPTTPQEVRNLFSRAQALEPVYDPNFLIFLGRQSSSLNQCFEALVTNIDSCGWRPELIIDPEAKDADEKIADELLLRQLWNYEGDESQIPLPTPEEVEAEKERMRLEMRIEKLRLVHWIEYCCSKYSFTELRRRTRRAMENIGYGAWELSRGKNGRPNELFYLPSYCLRIVLPDQSEQPTHVIRSQKISAVSYGTVLDHVRFNRYIMVVGKDGVWLKEFGDPRIISRRTGQTVAVSEDGSPAQYDGQWPEGDGPANEVCFFPTIPADNSPYGVIRWSGQWLGEVGKRESEEVARSVWEHKGWPLVLFLVSGAKWAQEVISRVEDIFKSQIEGTQNYWRPAFLQAAPSGANDPSARVRMDMKELRPPEISTHLEYARTQVDKTGATFRLARPLRGEIAEVNRAAFQGALEFGENQVFQPERQTFDDWMNRHLLPALGIRYWRFVSNGPIPRESGAVAELLGQVGPTGAFTLNELREAATDVFNRPLPRIDAPWADLPLPLLLSQMGSLLAMGGLPSPSTAPTAAPSEKPKGEVGGKVTSSDEPTPGGEDKTEKPEMTKADIVKAAEALIEIRNALLEAEGAQIPPHSCAGHGGANGKG